MFAQNLGAKSSEQGLTILYPHSFFGDKTTDDTVFKDENNGGEDLENCLLIIVSWKSYYLSCV